MYRARDATTGAVLAERLRPAHTHWTRLKGLLGTRSLAPGDGLWLKPCKQVHMFGMRYAIDVVFLDDAHRVAHAVHALQPGKISPKIKGAKSVLELPEGTLARIGLSVGTHIEIQNASPEDEKGAPIQRTSWLRTCIWVIGFIAATTCFTLLGRSVMPWKNPCPEYLQFWAAGNLLAAGHSPYDLPRLAEIERAYGWDKATSGLGLYEVMPYNYPPSLLGLVLALLVPLGFSTARMAWLVINSELLFLTGYMLRNAVASVPRIVPVVMVPIFGLSVLSVLVGQVTALILFLTSAAWRLLQRGWDRSAGCVLATLSIKPQVTGLMVMATLLWLARQRRWRAVATFAAVSVLFLALGTWWVPSWPLEIVRNLAQVPAAMGTDTFPWWGTTWLLVLRSLGLEGARLWAFYAVVAVPLCWAVLRSVLQQGSTIDDVLAVSMLATFFVTPTARIYDLPLLLIPLFVLLGKRIPELASAAVLVILIMAPYVHMLFFIGSIHNMPTHVWFFWIPLLLAGLWFGESMASTRHRREATRPLAC